jgi:putative component of membrane protein insertase Oxa1/YidC/SpoIIIJ protein YidD
MPRMSASKIPGLLPGIFFLLWATLAQGGASLRLAEELLAEGQWEAARREGLRAMGEDGTVEEGGRARVVAALASLRLGRGREEAEADLEWAWRNEALPVELRCEAAYELGMARWEDGGAEDAFSALRYAFTHARNAALFWRAGCSLHALAADDKRIRKEHPALWQALQSCQDAWPGWVRGGCRPMPKGGGSWGALPGRWIVSFYRSQVGPAIGSRCDLLPSCSEYFLLASRKHGLLGIAIMADRFVREPSVVAAREKPVTLRDGHVRYADPLEDHDFWMEGRP